MQGEEIFNPCSHEGEKVVVKDTGRPATKTYGGKEGVIVGQESMNWGVLVRFDNGEEASFFPDELDRKSS